MVDTTGGGSATMSIAVPDTSSTVAVISTSPAPTPVASPDPSMVATIISLLVQVTTTPGIAIPSEVSAIASNCWVSPITIDSVGGLTVTLDTTGGGTETISIAVSENSPAEAVIATNPALSPDARPAVSVVATVVSLLVHVKVTSGTVVPSEVRTVASNCCDSPTSIDAMGGLTVTLATIGGGSLTVIVTGELVTPPVAAVIVAVPAPVAVTTPEEVILTTAALLLAHVKVTSSRSDPPAVNSVAVNVLVSPMFICWADAGLTVIRVTGGCVTVTVTGGLDTPFPMAQIVAVPAETAVATPEELMVTTAVLLLDHEKLTPLTVDPSEARAEAVNRCVPPTSMDAEEGLTETLETVGVTTGGFVGESLPHPAMSISGAPIPAMSTNKVNTNDLEIFMELWTASPLLPQFGDSNFSVNEVTEYQHKVVCIQLYV